MGKNIANTPEVSITETEKLIERFYTCFQLKDFKGMQDCYGSQARFKDSVFDELDAQEVRCMWEMLCKRAKDLDIRFSNIKADEKQGSANWIAHYTFSSSGNKVINQVKASFRFENGKIVEHEDDFNFYSWARQALGLPGLLLGWTPFMKARVRKKAKQNLMDFMRKNAAVI